MSKKYAVTGCAGFIGSNLVDKLLGQGHQVVGFDNLCTGQKKFMTLALANPLFTYVECDLLEQGSFEHHFASVDTVFHLSANADVRFGADHPRKDLEQNTIVTYNILEAMRKNGVRQIAFSSTGSVYGEAAVIPTPEDAPFPIQTSLYGASKLACEGLIAAYCETFQLKAWIFRFVSILGERYSHGHIFDFYKQLMQDSSRLTVLGNGTQKKSYLYVQDCLDAIFIALQSSTAPVQIFNLGADHYCQVTDSIGWICETLGVTPDIQLGSGNRGWIGDNPFIFLESQKIRSLGWTPKLTIREGIIKTVQYLQQNEWLFHVRS
ncbi:MAG: NAD-dependent epimerase/dehydratase family protein [Pseudomonadota bacterium]